MFRPKLLCVDDDAAIRELYRTMLSGCGYEVRVAQNGAEALQTFNSSRFDAVILDYEMPAMNGTELAAAVKSIKPTVPIVMVSGRESVAAGAPRFVDAAVAKGSELGVLLDKLELLGAGVAKLAPASQASRLLPLGSALATVALAAYVLPRLWR